MGMLYNDKYIFKKYLKSDRAFFDILFGIGSVVISICAIVTLVRGPQKDITEYSTNTVIQSDKLDDAQITSAEKNFYQISWIIILVICFISGYWFLSHLMSDFKLFKDKFLEKYYEK